MEYIRDISIPFYAAEFQVTVIIDGKNYQGLLHVSRKGSGLAPETLHPTEIVYFSDGAIETPPVKPHQDGNSSWDANFSEPTYIKRMTFEEYIEAETAENSARDFSLAVEKITNRRIIIR